MTQGTPDKTHEGDPDGEARPRSQWIAAYYDGELSGHKERELEALLACDAGARAELNELRSLSRKCSAVTHPTLPVEALEAVRAEIDQIEDRTVLLRISGWAAGLAAMVLISCGLLLGAGVNKAAAASAQTDPFAPTSALLQLQSDLDISEAGVPVEAHLSDLIATELLASGEHNATEGS